MDYAELEARLIDIRRQLHQFPELSLEEYETTKRIKEWLTEKNIVIKRTTLKTGVFADIKGKYDSPKVAIRADIDALPIEEETNLPYASKVKGKMHACGHDFHTAALIGAAYLLQKSKDTLPGSIRLLFQPAEESGGGAELVKADEQLKDIDYIIGLHNKPDLPVGTIGLKNGAMMAAVDRFIVEINGKGSHAALPHAGHDPIVASAHLITAIQTIVSRNVSPLEGAVISITRIVGGNTWNVIPNKVTLEGTIRTFSNSIRQEVKKRFELVVQQTSLAFGQQAKVHWYPGPPALINDLKVNQSLHRTAEKQLLTVIDPEPSMGGEDFSHYLEDIRGAFVFFGTNGTEDWHHPKFTIDELALMPAAKFLYESAKDLLKLTNKKDIGGDRK
ncbi:amidohydrolase [Pseudogracilibacillus sp. SE30717A]|uniref:amidohydrolase n=1 Tax=Pseudogracilibacillus sp. SE30717A TaxID=3098293 RepID=UPI00300E1929